MLREVLLFNLILCPCVFTKRKHHKKADSSDDLGGELITSLRNDANLDLSMDEEYEDLRAELLAYHTALSSLTEPKIDTAPGELPPEIVAAVADEPGNNVAEVDTRKACINYQINVFPGSMKTTPCWQRGGICIHHKMCVGHKYLTEVPGCKNNLEVCCFTWNKFEAKDMFDKGISNLALPWTHGQEFGGKGPVRPDDDINESEDVEQQISEDEYSDGAVHKLLSMERSKKKINKLTKLRQTNKKHRIVKKEKPALVMVLKSNKK